MEAANDGSAIRPRPHLVRFRDLDPASINVELQVHTDRTDGEASINQILDAAVARGLSALAFTEHVRLDSSWFQEFAAEVRELSSAYPDLEVYVGCEAKALDRVGGLDCSEQVRQACDIVLGVVHRLPDGRGGLLPFESLSATELAEAECELSLGLLRNAPIHVLGHPGGMYQRRYGRYPDELFRRMMEVSLERRIAIEINSSYLVDLEAFLRLCDEVNPYVSIGSDVHRLTDLAACRSALLQTEYFR
jgi:putative hydrolase